MRTPRRPRRSLLALALALGLAALPAACNRAPTATSTADAAVLDETPPPPDTTGRGPGSNGPPY